MMHQCGRGFTIESCVFGAKGHSKLQHNSVPIFIWPQVICTPCTLITQHLRDLSCHFVGLFTSPRKHPGAARVGVSLGGFLWIWCPLCWWGGVYGIITFPRILRNTKNDNGLKIFRVNFNSYLALLCFFLVHHLYKCKEVPSYMNRGVLVITTYYRTQDLHSPVLPEEIMSSRSQVTQHFPFCLGTCTQYV